MITVLRHLPDASSFLMFVLRRWREDRCPQIAGSLTYTTLLALVPIFAIAVAVLSSSPFFEDVMSQIKIFLLLNLLPEIAHKIITVYMVEFSQNAARLTWAGIGVVFVIAVGLMLLIDRSLNDIWRVRSTRPFWLSVLGYVALLMVGPLLIGISVSVTTYLMALSVSVTGVPPAWHPALLEMVPVVMSALAFFLVYIIIPHRRVPWRHALAGGVFAAVLFETVKSLFAFYVRFGPAQSVVYGAFAAVPIFMIWVYLSWLVVLLGAEVTAAMGYWRGGLWKHERSASNRFRAAIALARALAPAAPAGLTLDRLREATGLPITQIEDTLMQMTEAGMTRRMARDAFALARAPDKITVEEIYRAAVGPLGAVKPGDFGDISPDFERAAREMQAGLDRPLSALDAPAPATPIRKPTRGKARSARSAR